MFTIGKIPRLFKPEESLKLLKDGNNRFVEMKREMASAVVPSIREELIEGQNPYAAILCCSDSRVPPEIIFDEGLGRLFVVRIAGNVLSPLVMGSLEYILTQSGCSLILILGHENCGAVTTAQQCYCSGLKTSGYEHIDALIVNMLDLMNESGCMLDTSSLAIKNVEKVARELYKKSPVVRQMVDSGDVGIVKGFYKLECGEVSFI